jgi:uncharacterized pyridoxamine 5'-phosphate oxidase family protein
MKENVISFVEENWVAYISTYDGSSSCGVPIYYLFVENDNAFYFLTKNKTKKYANIQKNNKASLTIFTENPPTVFTAVCAGEVFDFKSMEHIEYVNKLVAIHSSQECYPTPILTLKAGGLSLIKLRVKSCRLKSYKKNIGLLSA